MSQSSNNFCPSPFHGDDYSPFLHFFELEAKQASGEEEKFVAADELLSSEE